MTVAVEDLGLREVKPTPEMIAALNDAKVNLSLASPIFAYTVMKVDKIFFCDNLPRKTAGAIVHESSNMIAFDPEFFMETLKNTEERTFILYHELDHIFFDHVDRMNEGDLDPETWNRATDYYINLNASGIFLLEGGGIGTNPRYQKYMRRPADVLYDEKFLGLSSDEIYDILKKDEDSKSQQESKKEGSSGDSGSSGEPSGGGTPTEKGHDELLGNGGTPTHRIENQQTLKAAAVAAEMMQSRGVSSSSGEEHLIKRIDKIGKPKVKWTDRIMNSIRDNNKTRVTYNKWSLLSSPRGGIIFPSRYGERVKILFSVDTSGSMMEEDYHKALGELSGVLETFDHWEVEFVLCDTKIISNERYYSEDNQTLKDIAGSLKMGYGTLMSPVIEHANELYFSEAEEFDAIIILTDGYLLRGDIDNVDSVNHNVIVVSTSNQELSLSKAEVIILDKE